MAVNMGTATAYMDLDTSKFNDGVAEVNSAWQTMSSKSATAATKMQAVGSTLTSVGMGMSTAVTLPIAAAGTAATKTAIEFESAFAGVRKTVDATEEEYSQLSEAILDMSEKMPTAATEIASVMEIAGQLGVRGTENLVTFTETMVMLGDATNMSAEDAATALARFQNILGTSSEDISKLGSTIVKLGNNFATTESDITQMSQRLAAGGKIAGLTEPEIFALATAMSSVGIEAEAGGTAMTETLAAMEKAVVTGGETLDQFAYVANVTSDEFASAWKNEPIKAIQMFIEGVGKLEDRGVSATIILDEMGLSGIRQSNMIKSMGLASDLLATAVDTANEAWSENTALVNEAEQRYGTMASRLSMLKNQLSAIAIQFGTLIMPYVEKFAAWLSKLMTKISSLSEGSRKLVLIIAGVAAALGPLLVAVGSVLKAVGSLSEAFSKGGAMSKLFSSKLLIIIAAIAAVVAAMVYLYKTNEEFRQSMQDVWSSLQESFETLGGTLMSAFQQIAPLLGEMLRVIADFVGSVVTELAPVLASLIEFTANFISQVVTELAPLLSTLFSAIAGILQDIIPILSEVFDAVIPIISVISDVISSILPVLIDLTEKVVAGLSPVIDILGQIVSVVLEFAGKVLEKVGPLIVMVLESVAAILGLVAPIITVIFDALSPLIGLILDLVNSALPQLLSIIVSLLGALEPAFDILASVIGVITNTLGIMMSLIKGDFDSVDEYAGNLLNDVLGIGEGILEGLAAPFSLVQEVVEPVVEFLRGIVASIGAFFTETLPEWGAVLQEWLDNLPEMIGYALGYAAQSVANFAVSLWNWVTVELPKIIEGIGQWFSTLPGKIWEWLQAAYQNVVTWGANMVSEVKTKMKEFVDAAVKKIKELPDDIKRWITTAVDWLKGIDLKQIGKDIMSSLWSGLKAVWDSVASWFNGVAAKIQGFLSGVSSGAAAAKGSGSGSFASGLDYVPRTMQVVVHEGEQILTKQQARGQAQGVTVNISLDAVVNNDYDIDKLAKRLGGRLSRELMARGYGGV